MPSLAKPKVLLIGWDAADWKVINPLLDNGLMPALNRLVNGGVIGNLATLDPPLSPMLWTSVATGKTADQHGILGFTQPTPDGKSIRPVLGTSRKARAIWNMLNNRGIKTNVIGWWPSHPAEPVDGICVSNFFHRAAAPLAQPWPPAPGAVYPPSAAAAIASCRVHPGELTGAHILPFVPDANTIDQDQDKRLAMLAKIIADAASVQAAATWTMEHADWDFMAVYFDAIDHFGHAFMKFHPPRMPGVPDDLFQAYRNVVSAGYRFHDMMLDQLLEQAGPETTVILMSDHGFHSDHLRPLGIPKEPAGPAIEHRAHGILCMHGPDLLRDDRIYGATILDVAPTILTMFGLPIGKDMAGKPLLHAFKMPPQPAYIESWEDAAGPLFSYSEETRTDPWAEHQALQQLVDLGYIDPIEGDRAELVERTVRESQYYLSRVFLSTGRRTSALPILERLCEQHPDEVRYAMKLAQCYLDLGRTGDARRALDVVLAGSDEAYPALDILLGSMLLAEGKPDEALTYLRRAEASDPRFPALHVRLGQVYLQKDLAPDAERAFLKALTIDPESPDAHHGLAGAYIRKGDWSNAAEAALRAVGLRFHFPMAHFRLGHALMKLGYYERSAEAFEVCVAQAPGVKKAHFWLSELYRNYLDEPRKAADHFQFAEERIT